MRQITGISAVNVKVTTLGSCTVTLETILSGAQDVWIYCDDPQIILPDNAHGTWPRMIHFGVNDTFISFPVLGMSIGTTTLYACEYGAPGCSLDDASISTIAYVTANIVEGIGEAIPIAALTLSPASGAGGGALRTVQLGKEAVTCILELHSLPDPTKPAVIALLDISNRAMLSPPANSDGSPSTWPYAVLFPPMSRTVTVLLSPVEGNNAAGYISVQIFASNYLQKRPFKPAVIIQRITLKA